MMKKLLLLSSLLLPTASFARPLADLSQSGGFCPGKCPSTSITLEENGAVIATTNIYVPTPSVQKRTLAFLDKDVVSAIVRDIASVTKDSAIVDLNQDEPICTDIPQITYTVYRGEQKIIIGYDRDCHQYRLADYSGAELATQLRNFLNLAYYAQR